MTINPPNTVKTLVLEYITHAVNDLPVLHHIGQGGLQITTHRSADVDSISYY